MLNKIICGCAVLLLVACSKPMDAVIPSESEQQPKFAEKVISKLSEEDKKLYAGWLTRRGISSVFSKEPLIPEGTTVGAAIADQREWIAKQEAAKAEELRLIKEREQAKAAALELLNKSASITFAGKDFLPKNYSARRYSDQQVFHLKIKNTGTKDIKGLRGKLTFIDMFGSPIRNIRFEITDPITTGDEIKWDGVLDINEFMSEHTKLRDLTPDQYTTTTELATIVFADGTQLSAP